MATPDAPPPSPAAEPESVASPPTPADPAPIETAPPAPASDARPRGAHLLTRGRLMFAGAALVLAAMAVVAFLFLRPADDYTPTARDFVTKMAARDAVAAKMLDSTDLLPAVAAQMGLVGVPATVTLSVEDLKATQPQPTAGATSLKNGDQLITATFTLTARGTAGSLAHADETLTARATRAKDGTVRLADVHVGPALVFDGAAYFGTAGTSQADATRVADDLRKGNAWIPGVVITTTPSDESLSLPDEITESPDHLTTYRDVTSTGSAGIRTTWTVRLTSGLTTAGLNLGVASAVTTEPVANQVTVGSMTDADAIEQATAAIDDFTANVRAGSVAAVNDGILPGANRIDASGIAAMKKTMPEAGGDGATIEADGVISVKIGDFTVVRGDDGSWMVDGSESYLVATVRGGNGNVHVINASRTGSQSCTTKITIALVKIEFYTRGGVPVSQFSFASSKDCDMGDEVLAATVNWQGHPAPMDLIGLPTPGSEPATTTYRFVPLPVEVSPSGPVTITITQYGSPGALLPDKMAFATK